MLAWIDCTGTLSASLSAAEQSAASLRVQGPTALMWKVMRALSETEEDGDEIVKGCHCSMERCHAQIREQGRLELEDHLKKACLNRVYGRDAKERILPSVRDLACTKQARTHWL